MKKILFIFVLGASISGFISKNTSAQSNVITCSEFHKTKPLREIVAEHPVDMSVLPRESEDREHRIAQKYEFTAEDGPQYGNEPSSMQKQMGTVQNPKAALTSWAGQAVSGMYPLDPSGAVGLTQYVQMINATTFKVYNKTTGTVLLTATLGNLWSPATANNGDPIVLYDKAADRWFLSQFGSSSDKKIYIAISQTGDATGSWYTYTFTSAQFPDYLKFSVWADGYYMTSNQTTQKVYCFERDRMLVGNSSARAVYTTFSPPNAGYFFVPLPGDASDGTLPSVGTPCPIFSYSDNGWGTSYSDAINIYNASVSWGTTASMTITAAGSVSCAAFDASYDVNWNDISQPGTSQKLDGIGGVLTYRAQWKTWSEYNSVVLNWGVKISSTQRSIKWCELRQDKSTGTWSMYQEGIYTPDTDNRWLGSIAMDNNGGIGLCYSKSNSSSTYMSLAYAGRRSCDPLGTLPISETIVKAGTGSQTNTNRDGDYSETTLDPDGITFWHTGMYLGSGGAQKTQIYSFQIPACSVAADVSIAITAGSNPSCAGSSVTFTATPTNGGTSPTYQWKVNGNNVGTNSPTYTTNTLANNDVVTCVMTSNLSGVTGNPATSVPITMTINAIPATPTASSNSPVCAGTSINLTTPTVTGASYSWSGPNSFTSTVQNPTITNVTTAMAGIYTVSVTVNGCTSLGGTTTVTVNTGPPTPTASSNSPVCVASTINLSTPTVTGASYSWSGPNGFTSSQQNPVITNATSAMAGTYSVSITLGGCPSLGGTTVVEVNATPTVAFSATPTSTACSGFVQFTDASTGNPSAWQWNFGDGQTSTLQSPSHTYLSSGIYSVTLTATNNCGNNQLVKTNYITIDVLTAPAVTDGSRCGTGSVTLSATGSGTLNWYDAATGGNLVNTGTTYTTPSISTTTTYYVESDSTMYGTSQYVGPIYSGGGATNSNQSWEVFDCFAPVRLVSVSVYASSQGNRLIELKNSSGTTLQSATVNIPAGASRMTLNFDIPVGTNLRLVAPASCGLYRLNSGVNYPYTLPGLISIKTSSATTNPLTYYYYFYDWEVKTITNCSSARVPVVATIDSNSPASVSISASSTAICSGTSVTFTATPTNGGDTPTYQWQINGNNVGTNSSSYTSTSLSNNDVVTCTMTSSSSCVTGNPVVTSNSITMTVNNTVTPTVAISASSNDICAGNSVTFTATPTNGGSTPTYQWQVNGVNVGNNTSTYTTTNLANGSTVSCMVTSSLTCANPVIATSNIITMTVHQMLEPAISITSSNTTICSGDNVTFTAYATNQGTSPTYQWQVNGTNAGTNNSTFSSSTLNNNDVVTCILTSSENCVSTNNILSNAITITVNNITPTASFTYISNQLDFTFTNTSTGANSYLWDFGDGTTSTLQNPTHTYINPGIYTIILTVYGPCDSSQAIQSVNAISYSIENVQSSFTVGIYPNPASDIVTVDMEGYESKNVEIIIQNEAGKKVYSYKLQNSFGNSKVNVDLSKYDKGMYYFTVRFDKSAQHFKVVHK